MAFEGKNKVAIVGVGQSEFGRRLERPVGALAVDACLAAIEDAGLTLNDIDGLATFPEGPGPGVGPEPGVSSAPLSFVADALGVEQLNWWSAGGGMVGNISTAVATAVDAIANNRCRYVLLWRAMWQPGPRGERKKKPEGEKKESAPRPAPRMSGSSAYAVPFGIADGPSYFAPAYMRYMKLYGAKREHMAAYAVTMRANANKNPKAMFYDTPMTFDDYMNARMIAEPLCLFDCDMPIDGAGALILARAEYAKDLKQTPAYVTALGSGGWDWRNGPLEEYMQDTAGNLGRTLWASTDMKPSDMSGAMFYDGFSPDIYWWLEGLGFCGRGEAYEWIQDDRIAIGGELPLNTFGGQVSEGRLHGIGHWIEATRQIQGRADDKPGDGARQIPNVENILVATGMTGHGSGAILSKNPR
jgi:acetyl-CoA acetyltransferase